MRKAIYGAVIENEAAYYAAAKRNIIANAMKTFRKTHEDAEAIEAAIDAGRMYDARGGVTYAEGFIGSMARSFDTYGKLTPNQVAAIRKGIESRAARKAEWADKQATANAHLQHLGPVGEKITLTLTLKKAIVIGEYQQYRWSPIISRYLLILEDADKNVVIYCGTSNAMPYTEGNTVTIKATVKEHGVRNGTKQTVIQRPKAA
jgi:hypothetical protein